MAGHSRNDAGEVIGTEGFYVDVTRSIEEHQTTITEAIRNRQAPIHHRTGKGVLMMVYGIDADAAFDVLKWCSQNSHIKLRLLAEGLMSQVQSLQYGEVPPGRSTFNQILLAAGQGGTDA